MRRDSTFMPVNFSTGSVHSHVMVQRVPVGEHPLRHALADDRHRLAAVAVGYRQNRAPR